MKIRIDLKILLYMLLFYFTRQLNLYILVMLFAFLHECAHILIAIFLKFKIVSLEIMPFGFFTNFYISVNDYNKKIGKSNLVELKKIPIALIGPISNLIIIEILGVINRFYTIENLNIMIYANLSLCLFNLIPIYPLDGGRLWKSVLKISLGYVKAEKIMKKISFGTVILLTIFSSILILYLKNIAILLVIIYIWGLIEKKDNRFF